MAGNPNAKHVAGVSSDYTVPRRLIGTTAAKMAVSDSVFIHAHQR